MRLIKPSFEILEQPSGLDGVYKMIELAGRTCYKSEDKITEDSAKSFVDRMIKSGHGAMLEHGTVYLAIPMTTYAPEAVNIYHNNSYSKVNECNEFIFTDKYGDKVAAWCVTTNLRVLVENDCLEDLEFICEPTEYHEKRITVRFICDRVTGESFLRHRAIDEDHLTVEGEVTKEMEKDINSFARESTRYCNYTKDKFNGEFTIITPPEFYDNLTSESLNYFGDTDEKMFTNMCCSISAGEIEEDFGILETWMFANLAAQWSYNRLIKLGWKPQQARRIIPLDIKSELVMTGFVSDWKHFFELRDSRSAHPQARELAKPLHEEFINRGYIK